MQIMCALQVNILLVTITNKQLLLINQIRMKLLIKCLARAWIVLNCFSALKMKELLLYCATCKVVFGFYSNSCNT